MPNNEEKNISKDITKPEDKSTANVEQTEVFEKFMKIFLARNANADEPFDAEKLNGLRKTLNCELTKKTPITVAFPECADVLLSLINQSKPEIDPKTGKPEEITGFFNDYFIFCSHRIPSDESVLNKIDERLLKCTEKWFPYSDNNNCPELTATDCDDYKIAGTNNAPRFPPPYCLPPTCVTLAGKRHLYEIDKVPANGTIKRLFMGDLVWLFYFDRMGIFKILGAILDDYAIKGNLPITNDSPLDTTDKIELVSIVLEAMTRKTKMGISSTVRDRNITYRRALGWILDEGRKLNLETVVNTAFTNLFHKFIQTSLEYYKDKRLATAIQASTNVNRVSVATLTSIKDTIDLIIRSFDPFRYGRVYSNTLSGIVWAVAGMSVIKELRTTLGIPSEYRDPDEYIPAAYDILIAKKSITPSETNRYDVHRDCAENARDILLDLEVIDFKNTDPGGELELWLDLIEGKIEGYRTAYRSLTGVDLGTQGTPNIEQQV